MTTPAVSYFQSATSSFRASATIVDLRRRPPSRLTRSWNQRASVDWGWWRSHSQASCNNVARSLGLPALETLARVRRIRFAKVSEPALHRQQLAFDWQSFVRAPPIRGRRRFPDQSHSVWSTSLVASELRRHSSLRASSLRGERLARSQPHRSARAEAQADRVRE